MLFDHRLARRMLLGIIRHIGKQNRSVDLALTGIPKSVNFNSIEPGATKPIIRRPERNLVRLILNVLPNLRVFGRLGSDVERGWEDSEAEAFRQRSLNPI